MNEATLQALVVDDSPAMRRHIIFALARIKGLSCFEATDGVDALKKIAAQHFDLVLTDINMPLMDGLKLVAAIRQRQTYASVPIVVITTESAVHDRQRALELGANQYLVKPVQSQDVLVAVRGLLGIST